MKKIIALLIILGAPALNGMEPTSPVPYEASGEVWVEELRRPGLLYPSAPTLPPEVTEKIVAFIHVYDNLDDTIKAIQKLSVLDKNFNNILNDMYGNPEEFKFLVHMIAEKFNRRPCDIASKFKTPAAIRYVDLCDALRNTLKAQDIKGVKQLLQEGADINGFPTLVAVMTAQKMPKVAMIWLLLDHGADPYATTLRGVTALRILNDMHRSSHEYREIKALLEWAMKKQ